MCVALVDATSGGGDMLEWFMRASACKYTHTHTHSLAPAHTFGPNTRVWWP